MKFTVIIAQPDWDNDDGVIRMDDNIGSAVRTYTAHVEAEFPEAAKKEAINQCRRASGNKYRNSDLVVMVVLEGHAKLVEVCV